MNNKLSNFLQLSGFSAEPSSTLIQQLYTFGIDAQYPAIGSFFGKLLDLCALYGESYELPDCFSEISSSREYFSSDAEDINVAGYNKIHGAITKYPFAAWIHHVDHLNSRFIPLLKFLSLKAVLVGDYTSINPCWNDLRLFMGLITESDIEEIEKQLEFNALETAVVEICKLNILNALSLKYSKYHSVIQCMQRLLISFVSDPMVEKGTDEKQGKIFQKGSLEQGLVNTKAVSGARLVGDEYINLSFFLKKSLLDSGRSLYAAVTLISWIRGCDLEASVDELKSQLENIKFEGCFYKKISQPKSLDAECYVPSSEFIKLAAPKELIYWAQGVESIDEDANEIKDKCKSILEEFRRLNTYMHRVNHQRIPGSLQKEVNIRFEDPIKTYLLCSKNIDEFSIETHYNACGTEVQINWQALLKKWGFDVYRNPLQDFHYGCEVKEHYAKRWYANILNDLEEAKASGCFIRIHNTYVIYVINVLFLATGGRPVVDPFSSWEDFDLDLELIKIVDKHIDSMPYRYIPLSLMATALLKNYQQHLLRLASVMNRKELVSDALINNILALSKGHKSKALPLFFLLDESGSPLSIQFKHIRPAGCDDLPENIGRKLFAFWMSRQLDMNTSRSLLGHVNSKIPFLGKKSFSGNAYSHQIRLAIDKLLMNYAIKPLDGLEGRIDRQLEERYSSNNALEKLKDNESKGLKRKDLEKKAKNSERRRLINELVRVSVEDGAEDDELEKHCVEAGFDFSKINPIVKQIIKNKSRKGIITKSDNYIGGANLKKNVAVQRDKKKAFTFSITTSSCNNMSRSELDAAIYISLILNTRICNEAFLHRISGCISAKVLLKAEQHQACAVVEGIDYHARDPWLYKLDYITTFLIKHAINKQGEKYKFKFNAAAVSKFLASHLSISLRSLLIAQGAANTFDLDALHASFLRGRIKSVGFSTTTLMRLSGVKIEKIKADIPLAVKKSVNRKSGYRGALIKCIRQFEQEDFQHNSQQRSKKNKRLHRCLEQAIEGGELSPCETLSALWGMELSKNGTRYKNKLAFNTVTQYTRRVCNLLAPMGSINPQDIDEISLQEKIASCFSEYAGDKADAFNRFDEFHHTIWPLLGLPYIETGEIGEDIGGRLSRVFNNVMSYREYNELLQKLSVFENADVLQAMVILYYRFGTRPKELAFIESKDCWITSKNEVLVNIQNNQFRSLKNGNAIRLIRQAECLTEFEFSIIRSRVKAAKDHLDRFGGKSLFFNKDFLADKTCILKNLRTIRDALKDVTNANVTIYSFRHSYASRLICQCYDSHSYLMAGMKCDLGLSYWLRETPTVRKKYEMVSQLLGHSSIGVTAENYDHASQYIWQTRVVDESLETLRTLTFKSVSHLCGINEDALRKMYQRDENYLTSRIVKDYQLPQVNSENSKVEDSSPTPSTNDLDIKTLDALLCSYLGDAESFSQNFNIPIENANAAIKQALLLSRSLTDVYDLKKRIKTKAVKKFTAPKQRLLLQWSGALSRKEKDASKRDFCRLWIESIHEYRVSYFTSQDDINDFADTAHQVFDGEVLVDSESYEKGFNIKFSLNDGADIAMNFMHRVIFLLILEENMKDLKK